VISWPASTYRSSGCTCIAGSARRLGRIAPVGGGGRPIEQPRRQHEHAGTDRTAPPLMGGRSCSSSAAGGRSSGSRQPGITMVSACASARGWYGAAP
jgi:hypothetical protein